MRNFRLLKADEIECRISQVTDKGCGLLLYKTARTDYALLDETVGMMKWQNDYQVIDGKMYCGIAVMDNLGNWVWKWNCGTESNTEAEKGQASDAMKRAGFAWGIGTELYSAPFIWIPNELLQKRSGNKIYDKFFVSKIEYDDNQDISELQIKNDLGAVVFTHPRTKQQKTAEKPPVSVPTPAPTVTPKKAEPAIVDLCVDCNKGVTKQVKDYSMKKYGYCLCMDCQKKYANK